MENIPKKLTLDILELKKKKKILSSGVNVWQISTTREGQHQVWVEKL